MVLLLLFNQVLIMMDFLIQKIMIFIMLKNKIIYLYSKKYITIFSEYNKYYNYRVL